MTKSNLFAPLLAVLTFTNHLIDHLLFLCMAGMIIICLWGIYTPTSVYIKPKTFTQSVNSENKNLFENNEDAFLQLKEQYPDIVGWVTIEGTNIDYPIVQGKDNLEYLNKGADGSSSIAGSIYLDYRNTGDFSDYYSLLYGHHMSHQRMFGQITEFLNADYFNEHTEGILHLPDGDYVIHFFACCLTTAYDDYCYSPFGYESLSSRQELLDHIQSTAKQYRQADVLDYKIIGLSTCYTQTTDGRAILYGYLEKVTS